MATIYDTLINKTKTVRINKNVNFFHPIKLRFEEGPYPLGVNSYKKCLDHFVLAS